MPRRSEPYVTRVDWTALALLGAGLLVALCVFSYRPAPPTLDSTGPGPVAGTLGLAGELVARPLVDALGVSVYTLLAAWFMLVVLLVLRQIWWVWAYRFFGWCLLVPGVAIVHGGGEAFRLTPEEETVASLVAHLRVRNRAPGTDGVEA